MTERVKPEVYELADRLHSTSIRLLRLVRHEDVVSGVGPARLSALSVLVFGGAKSLKELSAIEQVRPPTMSRIVEGLVQSGLAKRVLSSEDARAVVITATVKGKAVLNAGRRRRVNALGKRLRSLDETERAALEKAVDILRTMLGPR